MRSTSVDEALAKGRRRGEDYIKSACFDGTSSSRWKLREGGEGIGKRYLLDNNMKTLLAIHVTLSHSSFFFFSSSHHNIIIRQSVLARSRGTYTNDDEGWMGGKGLMTD